MYQYKPKQSLLKALRKARKKGYDYNTKTCADYKRACSLFQTYVERQHFMVHWEMLIFSANVEGLKYLSTG